ncbi:unnamed protein product [Brassica rapa]|uniref:F-box domain-containing protein n=1 Tax=Brassica campestris TaxID=3711 RepID=A0A8D9HEZ6_BRACM|nr:unnamed protein product [Brassica rapa]
MNLQIEPPEKKRKNMTSPLPPPPPPPSCPSFSLFPDEIFVNCLARISRMYYPTLSIISKSFRSLLSSTELYAARSHIGSTEQCLYVCLSDESYQSPQWFTLCINPNRTLTVSTIKKKKKKKTKTLGKSLAPIPSSDSPSISKSTVVVGSDIYVIGGPIKTEPSCPSSAIRILDCRTHTWRDAPSMIVARNDSLTCFYDGKIYVMGGCGDDDEPWAEVFDIKTQTWERLSDPGNQIRNIWRCDFYTIIGMKGKIHFWNSYRAYAYDTSQDNWESMIDGGVWYHCIPKSACEIDGVWYHMSYGRSYDFRWTMEGETWKAVKGLDSLIKMYNRNGGSSCNKTKLVSCCGKLLLLWEGYMKHNPNNRKKIWCAEITLETDDEGEVWGNAEWIDVVKSVPTQCELLNCLVVSV